MFKESVRIFTSLNKKVSEVSCQKRQSCGSNVHKFEQKAKQGFMLKASVRIFTSLTFILQITFKFGCESAIMARVCFLLWGRGKPK